MWYEWLGFKDLPIAMLGDAWQCFAIVGNGNPLHQVGRWFVFGRFSPDGYDPPHMYIAYAGAPDRVRPEDIDQTKTWCLIREVAMSGEMAR